jgi:hypothetical protein
VSDTTYRRVRLLILAAAVLIFAAIYVSMLLKPIEMPRVSPREQTVTPPIPQAHTPPEPIA